MTTNKKIYLAVMSMLWISSAVAQSNITNDFNTSASIESYCKIETQDINFGVVNLPLTAQSANSQMNILCSNSTAYKIDLSYGGVYGSGTGMGNNKDYSYKVNSNVIEGWNRFDIIENNINIGYLSCSKSLGSNYVVFTPEVAKLYGTDWRNGTIMTDKFNACDVNSRSINAVTFSNLGKIAAYSYGVMNGSFNGDKLAYSIENPSDSSKIWNNGISSYEAIGIGSSQTINMNAKIVPESSSSSYIAADTYLDIVVATITY